jgi:hypothetical protein
VETVYLFIKLSPLSLLKYLISSQEKDPKISKTLKLFDETDKRFFLDTKIYGKFAYYLG